MMKCVNEDCQYFREHGKCSEVCTNQGITKIVTNADRIRNMSDEELAKFLTTFKNTFGEEYEGEMSCLDWLKEKSNINI